MIDEFSMLDHHLFRVAEGLCRKFAKKHVSSHPWGGRHVILLGDPAQLPAVSHKDIFGTRLRQKFTILLLREIKRATDPQLSSVLSKVRLGVCDKEVLDVLQTRLQSHDLASVDFKRTVVICSTVAECNESMHSVWKGYRAMPLVMMPVILIIMAMISVRQIMRGCSIVEIGYQTHCYLK